MIIINRHTKQIIAFFSFTIIWMFVGMLVNFHQYHLFGRVLIQQIQPIYVSHGSASSLDYKKPGQKGNIIAFQQIVSESPESAPEKTVSLSVAGREFYEHRVPVRIFLHVSNPRDPPVWG